MKKIEVEIEGMKIPKIEYDIYAKEKGGGLIKLNISICHNHKINLKIPVILDDNIDKLNSSSGYYNDICYRTASDNGRDIILEDRRNIFINNNKTICQEKCIFSDYNYDTLKAKCTCEVSESSFSFADIKFNITKLRDNFINIKNIANFNLLICINTLFTTKGLAKNIGSYILISLIISHFIVIFIFYKKGMNNKINEIIKDIIFALKNWKLITKGNNNKSDNKKNENGIMNLITTNNDCNLQNKKYKNNFKKANNNNIINVNIINKPSLVIRKKIKRKLQFKKVQKKFTKFNHFKKNDNKNYNINKIRQNNKIFTKNESSKYRSNNNNNISYSINGYQQGSIIKLNYNLVKENKKIIKRIKDIMNFNDVELNYLPYDKALKNDKRTFCQYYISLVKTKHIIIFTFFNTTDYNIKLIKIDLLFFNFTLSYIINGLFFSDDTIHVIYESDGSFILEYRIIKIIYSSLISGVITLLLQILALPESNILELKGLRFKKEQLNDYKKIDNKGEELNKNIKIKFIFYFIFSIIFLLFFWYYISMFCSVYPNTQMHLLKDTLISFGISFIYPFALYFLPTIFRIPALADNNRRYLYRISFLLQML